MKELEIKRWLEDILEAWEEFKELEKEKDLARALVLSLLEKPKK